MLTVPLTASAAEAMVLGPRVLPRVTILGRRSLVVFSDTLTRRLPKGREFTLSNETYRVPEGVLYEGLGIPPHITSGAPMPPLSLDERCGIDIRAAHDLILRQTK